MQIDPDSSAEWKNLWRELDDLRHEIDRAFEEFGFEGEEGFRSRFLPGRLARGYPLVNLHEDRDHLYNVLTIRGKAQHAAPGEPIYREFDLTNCFRQFELNEEIDQNQIKAELKRGVLTLHLPKTEKAKPRQIEVQVSS